MSAYEITWKGKIRRVEVPSDDNWEDVVFLSKKSTLEAAYDELSASMSEIERTTKYARNLIKGIKKLSK